VNVVEKHKHTQETSSFLERKEHANTRRELDSDELIVIYI